VEREPKRAPPPTKTKHLLRSMFVCLFGFLFNFVGLTSEAVLFGGLWLCNGFRVAQQSGQAIFNIMIHIIYNLNYEKGSYTFLGLFGSRIRRGGEGMNFNGGEEKYFN